jgi:hypothetical protein
MSTEIPRRERADLAAPAERVIRVAIAAVEGLGFDPRLSAALELLTRALGHVSDYVDAQTDTRHHP